jgi:hypothetical protein
MKKHKRRQRTALKGKRSATLNFFTLTLVIIGLSAYFTAQSLWHIGTVVIIALLTAMAGFYFWLWRYFK